MNLMSFNKINILAFFYMERGTKTRILSEDLTGKMVGRLIFAAESVDGIGRRREVTIVSKLETTEKKKSRKKTGWVVVSNMFYFHPYLGKIPILTNIFQRGWNHQLGMLLSLLSQENDILVFFSYGKKRKNLPQNRWLEWLDPERVDVPLYFLSKNGEFLIITVDGSEIR